MASSTPSDDPCPPSAEEISVRDMSKSAFGRELYNAILNLTAKVSRIEENQRIQEERAERDHRSIIDFGNSLTMTVKEQKRLMDSVGQLQSETTQNSQEIIEEIKANRQGTAELNEISIKTEQEQEKLAAAIQQVQVEIRQKADMITEKLEINSQAVAELKPVTENAERTLALLLERQKDHEQTIADVKSVMGNIESEQKKFRDEYKENQENAERTLALLLERQKNLDHAIADVKSVMVEIRQKTDTITEKLEIDSQAVAELKAVTIAAEKEQKSLSAEVMRIQESLNGIIENTSEMKRKQDISFRLQFWENHRIFEKFIGRWKLVKWEMNGVEQDISNRILQSESFESVPEGVMWKKYKKDGSEIDSWILTSDKKIKNKLDKEGRDCSLVQIQSDGSFKWEIITYNVEGNHLIERWPDKYVSTYEKC